MSRQFPHPFKDMAKRVRKELDKLPMTVSKIALEEFRGNFERQGYRHQQSGALVKWAPRKDGSDPGRAVLEKTGRLQRSLHLRPSRTHARVVNNAPYARIHNRGGAIKGRQRVWATSLRTGNTRLRTNPGGPPAAMPARPYMRTSRQLQEAISREFDNLTQRVFKGAKSE